MSGPSLDELLAAALERPCGPERDAWIDQSCGDDATLKAELRNLVSAHEDAGSFLGQPAMAPASAVLDTEYPGQAIGHYRLVEKIGEGGFGAVWSAEQSEPVRRRVALKIIKLGMDTAQVIARFEAERQALALMDHPHIAKVFDAGATESGRPYFVMELVRGESIVAFCDRNKLDTRRRLALFVAVCEAIQHAHNKGIIHRDIKPSNVLVSQQDGVTAPKVIDFGIAKATNLELTEKTLLTEASQIIGTPEYMSPEQAESAVDIDTRSDVYSLGVLLYALLTGTTPFDLKSRHGSGFHEILRVIREEEPPRPSTRLSCLGGSAAAVATQRHTDVKKLGTIIRGDLDWIVMKCLEKDRTRRYDTSGNVAADIQRHLHDEPVLAGPPSRSYRMQKFVRRNRIAVTASMVVMVAVVLGAVTATVGLVRAVKAEAIAREEADNARTEKAIAEAINEFLNKDLLAAVAPSAQSGKGKDVLMRDVLDEAAERIEDAAEPGGRFEDKPVVEAEIRFTLGHTYRDLGEYKSAATHLERALNLRRAELTKEHEDTLQAMEVLGSVYRNLGRLEEAEALATEARDMARDVLGDEHRVTLVAGNTLALIYKDKTRYDEAEALYESTIETMKRVLGEEDSATLGAMSNLVIVYRRQRRYAEAEALCLGILETRRRVDGEDDPFTLKSLNLLGTIYLRQGKIDEAEPRLREALEARRRVLGPEHRDTMVSLNSLASMYLMLGRFEDAEPLFADAVEILERTLGSDNADTVKNRYSLGYSLYKQERDTEALAILEEAEAGGRKVWPEGSATLGVIAGGRGDTLVQLERYDEAEPILLEAYDLVLAGRGPNHGYTHMRIDSLARLYEAWDKPDKAAEWWAKLEAKGE